MELISSKRLYESQLIEEVSFNAHNSTIYRYIRSIVKSDNLPNVLHLHSQTAFSDINKPSLFNSFFESVYTKDDDHPSPTVNQGPPSVETLDIIDLDVYTLLTKAQGIDEIGPKILRYCASALYTVIHHLFTISLWYCKIPSEWKVHCIVPIFK